MERLVFLAALFAATAAALHPPIAGLALLAATMGVLLSPLMFDDDSPEDLDDDE